MRAPIRVPGDCHYDYDYEDGYGYDGDDDAMMIGRDVSSRY